MLPIFLYKTIQISFLIIFDIQIIYELLRLLFSLYLLCALHTKSHTLTLLACGCYTFCPLEGILTLPTGDGFLGSKNETLALVSPVMKRREAALSHIVTLEVNVCAHC